MSKLRESSLGQLQRMPAILAAARQISHSIKPPAPNETVIPHSHYLHPRYPEAHYPPLRGLPLRTAPPFGPLTMPWFALTNQPKMSLADNEWLRWVGLARFDLDLLDHQRYIESPCAWGESRTCEEDGNQTERVCQKNKQFNCSFHHSCIYFSSCVVLWGTMYILLYLFA